MSGVHSQCAARARGVYIVAGRGLGRRERREAGGRFVYPTFRVGPWIIHSSSSTTSGKNALSRLFWAACRPSRRFPSRFLRPSHAGGVPMDASRLVAAFALAQGPGCDKSGGRPVAAGLGAGLLKHTHPLMPPPLRSVGLGDTSTDHIHRVTDKISLKSVQPASSRQQDTEVPQKKPRSSTSASMACGTAGLR